MKNMNEILLDFISYFESDQFTELNTYMEDDFDQYGNGITDNSANYSTWNTKPMEEWSSSEVINFIHWEALLSIDFEITVNLNKFENISGYIFQNLSEDNCEILSESTDIGRLIYKAKETYLRCRNTFSSSDIKNQININKCDLTTIKGENCLSTYNTNIDLCENNKKPGRPKCRRILTKKGKKSEKLWEFLIHLLKDEKTCPALIKWENHEEGTFKFVQSDKVARLWGNRKQNACMNYEKFSRAMRYYYKSKVLLPVPGKRLVYKFGPQATGWQENISNYMIKC